MKAYLIAAACLAVVIGGASSTAFAGIVADIVDVINGEPLPADRSAKARSALAEDRCKGDNPWRGDLQR
jgi:hypothetical protein